tara:strand:- start:2039 stop:2578 length:540 start_codon:yes stop_codon:yes gene_type:complete
LKIKEKYNMKNIKLIWGSDTGATEEIVMIMERGFLPVINAIEEVDEVQGNPEHWNTHDVYMIGLPTWYDGELQSSWEDYFEEFKTIDFTNKKVCIFGLGDQEGYGEYFVDGIGILAEVIIKNGGTIIGKTSTEGYDYEESKAEMEEGVFFGLVLDEDNQDELTSERVYNWIDQLKEELK